MSVAIRYVKSSENVADMMTKCLPAPAFVKHRDALMGQIDKYWYVQAENDVKEWMEEPLTEEPPLEEHCLEEYRLEEHWKKRKQTKIWDN